MLSPDYWRIVNHLQDEIITPKYQYLISDFYTEYPIFDWMVWFGNFWRLNLWVYKERIFLDLLLFLLDKHNIDSISENKIKESLNLFEKFCDTNEVSFSVQAELNGFQSIEDEIILSESLKIRRLTESEISQHYKEIESNGNLGINEFCIEYLTIWKLTNKEMTPLLTFSHETFNKIFEDVIVKLNVYKEWWTNQASLKIVPRDFCISGLLGTYYPFQERPFGNLSFSYEDALWFIEFYNIKVSEWENLEIWITRLFYSENRLKPIDSIIDAVIWLESLLLAWEKNETTLKFSMRFALFFQKSDREIRYKHAKKIYDIRSKVVHWSLRPNNLYKFDGIERSLNDISNIIKEDLRYIIKEIIRNWWTSSIRSNEFWEWKYFE